MSSPAPSTPGEAFWRTIRQAWRSDPTFVIVAWVAVLGMSLVALVAMCALLARAVALWKGCV
jgi:hypothetical protein